MPAEITMPQLSDTMTEGTVVKWHKKEGDRIKAGEEIADVETDKATMPMEAFDSGTLAVIKVQEGEKVAVGGVLGVIATGSEKPEEVKKKYAGGGAKAAPAPANAPAPAPAPTAPKAAPPVLPAKAGRPANAPVAASQAATSTPATKTGSYTYDILVIGGGPAGYAAAIRGATQEESILRRKGKSRRHVPQLGLHPHQGAARRRRIRPQDENRSRQPGRLV